MKYRPLGRTGFNVSEISFGAWAIGGTWGQQNDDESMATLHRAVDLGINFFDTADIYGDGRSERLIARLKRERSEKIIVATKTGGRLKVRTADRYNLKDLTEFIERSLKNLEVESLDLVQIHTPPQDIYYHAEVFDAMDQLVKAGKIRFYGVSVAKVEEALKAIEYPNVQTVQIIFNMFRHRPIELFFPEAKRRQIGILARVPLASGLLSGRLTRNTEFGSDDHRKFNRNGEAFDQGETFSGIDYETGLAAVEEVRALFSKEGTLAQWALRWILMFDAVSCAIPGARRPQQAEDNARASDLPPLTEAQMKALEKIYDQRIRPLIHHRW